jgi:hypothetical protein
MLRGVCLAALASCELLLGCSGDDFSKVTPGTAADQTSCAGLLSSGITESGVYELEPSGGQKVSTYCEMSLAGGGWTLIARSSNGTPSGSGFGWNRAQGSPSNPSAPFSLGVGKTGLAFTEVLVAQYENEADVVQAFVAAVPKGFVPDYANLPFELSPPFSTVVGSCSPQGGVWMLAWTGFTSETDYFFFRDHEQHEGFGLFPDGWNMASGSECQYNAGLSGTQGMIFVR